MPRQRRPAELSIAQTEGEVRLLGRLPSTWTGDSDSSEAGADLLPAANAERRDEAGQALPSRHRSPMRCGPTGRIGRPQVEAHGAGVGVDHSAAVAESRGPEKESGASAAIAEWDQGVQLGVSLWRRLVRVARGWDYVQTGLSAEPRLQEHGPTQSGNSWLGGRQGQGTRSRLAWGPRISRAFPCCGSSSFSSSLSGR